MSAVNDKGNGNSLTSDYVSVVEAARVLGVSRTHVVYLIKKKHNPLPAERVGKAYLIPRKSLETYQRTPQGRMVEFDDERHRKMREAQERSRARKRGD